MNYYTIDNEIINRVIRNININFFINDKYVQLFEQLNLEIHIEIDDGHHISNNFFVYSNDYKRTVGEVNEYGFFFIDKYLLENLDINSTMIYKAVRLCNEIFSKLNIHKEFSHIKRITIVHEHYNYKKDYKERYKVIC